MSLTPRELELLPALATPGESSDHAALAQSAEQIGVTPTELARLQAKLAADSILCERVYSLRAWDRQLAAALPRVTIPANLELRMRQTLALAEPALEPVSLPADSLARPHSRRHWLRGVAAGGVAAAAFYAGWLAWPRSRTLAQNEIASAGTWLDRYLHPDRWAKADWPSEEYPLPDVIGKEPFGWQDVAAEFQTPAVAYDYSTSDGQRAALFVIPQPVGTFTTHVPFRPQSSTLGMCVGHWQQGPNLMVLVVQGNESRYRVFWRPERAVPVV